MSIPLGTEDVDGVFILIDSGMSSEDDISVFFGFTVNK